MIREDCCLAEEVAVRVQSVSVFKKVSQRFELVHGGVGGIIMNPFPDP
ncbi:hypothetical protein SynROS8604_01141 [Synechococcus sp. ROS8604]|nr:hypothetical protein SynROS8604_01141 [Synechococcus sp. ROS8604]